jgi:hypothetical protein
VCGIAPGVFLSSAGDWRLADNLAVALDLTLEFSNFPATGACSAPRVARQGRLATR